MQLNLNNVVHESGRCWVLRINGGYEVYKRDACSSVRNGSFTTSDQEYNLRRAKEHCDYINERFPA